MLRLRTTTKAGLVLVAIFLLVRCGKLDNPKSSAISVPGAVTTAAKVFSVSVATIYETDTDNTEIPHGSNCTEIKCDPISIPEAQLYFGKLKLKANIVDTSKCSLFTFVPYSYRMSAQENFIPVTNSGDFTALDCRDWTVAGCYSGPATKLVPDFPKNEGVYYLPNKSQPPEWTVDSANTVRSDLKYDPGNKWVANDLVSDYRALGGIDYIANSMVDYRFICDDTFNDIQYSATLKIKVEPGTQGTQHPSWLASTTTTTTMGSTTTTTTTTSVTIPQVFRLAVSTLLQSGDGKTQTNHGSPCNVMSADLGAPVDCSISIPEAQLYYGQLKLDVTQINSSLCPIFSFEPYYYRMSNKKNFLPTTGAADYFIPGSDPSDMFAFGWNCTSGLGYPQCYSGVATQLVPNFPEVTSLTYFPSAALPSLSWTIDSAATITSTQKYNPGNRWSSNDLATPQYDQTDYVASSMHDYWFKCENTSGDALYSTRLKISVAVGTGTEFSNWVTPLSPASTVSTTTTTNPTVFQIDLSTIYESDGSNTAIPVLPDLGTQNSIDKFSTTATLKYTIPESKLYFSKLKLNAKVNNAELCPVFRFTPYGYQMSASSGFKPAKANQNFSVIDCSASPIPLGCFAGAVTELIPSYPAFRSIYYLPLITPALNWTINSGHSVALSQNYDPGNTWTGNDLATPTTGPGFTPPDYINDSIQGYKFECDDWYGNTAYTINMTISPDAGTSGVYKYMNWKSAVP